MNITLTIEFNPADQSIQLTGPVGEKGLCYMILELAKDGIRQHCEANKSKAGLIIPPAGARVPPG